MLSREYFEVLIIQIRRRNKLFFAYEKNLAIKYQFI